MPDASPQALKIRAYVEDQFLVQHGVDFEDDTNLFEAGIMDSFGYVQLVEFLQTEFGVAFDDDAILGNVMVSLERMVECLQQSAGTMPVTG
ncbi:acyl carrier protein [Cognatishimia sp. F0-27]|uniref:acyl carrier protein n=1 Tax=Cognatishimia sp. F0-27 TaxID=2816855 RepID=UPI001D0C9F12|nr:phosphopantetheine-binding protein [Cognatishimia sp. F0-27]MCC1493270.1 hypothetical protein [Cognatishimia sp. F0-27]